MTMRYIVLITPCMTPVAKDLSQWPKVDMTKIKVTKTSIQLNSPLQ